MPKDNRMQALESNAAHLTRTVEELSDIVARQQTKIDTLTRRVQMLMQREAEREQSLSGAEIITDERPPHW